MQRSLPTEEGSHACQILSALLSLLSVLCVCAQDAAKDDAKSQTAKTPAQERYDALIKEHETAREEFSKAYEQAKTDAEKEKLHYPDADEYAPRFLTLAREHPKDPAAVDALVWVATNCRQDETRGRSMNLLLKDYVESDKLGRVASALIYSDNKETERWLRQLLKESPHRQVKGEACYSLGRFLMGRAGATDDRKPAETFLEQALKEYGDVKRWRGNIAEWARGDLFELRSLNIGQGAPEIEGEDVKDQKFKLSEYRGKVVVIDFWGDW